MVKEHASGWRHAVGELWIVGGEKTAMEWLEAIGNTIALAQAGLFVFELAPNSD
jgi:hypothetical protein